MAAEIEITTALWACVAMEELDILHYIPSKFHVHVVYVCM